MGKGNTKSSATSATRKKHAKRAVGGDPPDQQPIPKDPKDKKLTKQQRAAKKKEPRVKAYVPPVKPAPIQPDPLETTGLVHRLPPDLVIVLRSFNKKAQVTKIRALEELQAGWIDKFTAEGDDGPLAYVLVDMLPVWLHHVSALFIHPSRRVRLLTAGVHISLLQIPSIHDALLSLLETAPPSQLESVLGTWYMAAHDVDRSVSSTALKSWHDAFSFTDQPSRVTLDSNSISSLILFLQRAILDPDGLYLYLNPAPPPPPAAPQKRGARREDPDTSSRSKAEELEEDPQDRKARLRVSGLGAVRRILESKHNELSDDLKLLLDNPLLWSSLHHAKQFFDIPSFGHGQSSVRKVAWALLQTILEHQKENLGPLIPILSRAVLRSVWVEPDSTVQAVMWQPVLKFLKEFPNAWELERTTTTNDDDHEQSEESGDEEEEEEPPQPKTPNELKPSIAYQEFLQFLERGCSGSPLQGYPTALIILSTIPSSIMASATPTPLPDLFTSFWKVLDGRALTSLHLSATSAAFLSSLLECMVFLIKRVCNDAKNGRTTLLRGLDADTVTRDLACAQLRTVWETLAEKGTLRVEPRAAARLVGHTLLSLNEVDQMLFDAVWGSLAASFRDSARSNPTVVSVFLKVLHDVFRQHSGALERMVLVLSDILHATAQAFAGSIGSGKEEKEKADGLSAATLLIHLLEQFREGLFDDPKFSGLVDNLAEQNALLFLQTSPTLLLAYLIHRKDQARCLHVWQTLLSEIAAQPQEAELSLKPLLGAVERGSLPRYLRPQAGELDLLIETTLVRALGEEAGYLPFVKTVLVSPDYFLSQTGYSTALQIITESFSEKVLTALTDRGFSFAASEPPLDLVSSLIQHPPRELARPDFAAVLPDVFVFAYVLPGAREEGVNASAFARSRDVWIQWEKTASGAEKDEAIARVKTKLKDLLGNMAVELSPLDILQVLPRPPPGIKYISPLDLFPSPREIGDLLDGLPSDLIHPSLAVLDPLIPPAGSLSDKSTSSSSSSGNHDYRGFSVYARIVEALLQVFISDRQYLKSNTWALRHFCALRLYTQDFLHIPSTNSVVFSSGTSLVELEALLASLEQVTTYFLTSPSDERWRLEALDAALGKRPSDSLGAVSRFLVEVVEGARKGDGVRDVRVLSNVLQHVFQDLEKSEAEAWMLLVRRVEDKAPRTSMAIVHAITSSAAEPPRLDRYRNELAASLLGIPPQKAHTDGLLALTKLALSAPNPDSDVVFLPQPRAVNVMKACQQWIASDDAEVDEEVEGAMTQVFLDLAPILQDVPGSHWDLVFDVLENNLENSSLAEDGTLLTLARSLKLVIAIQDLTLTNKLLRASWDERKLPILTLVRDLVTASSDVVGKSAPRSICRGLVLSILQNIPSSLIDQDTLLKMSHLVMDPSADIQKSAYQFLRSAAQKRTEYLVIEAGVDTEDAFTADIPVELLGILQHVINMDDDFEAQNVFGSLLGWQLLFDLFENASLKVRTSYIEQLRKLDVIGSYFIPTIISVLRLDQGPLKALKLDLWAVNEFHIEFFDGKLDFAAPVLTAHVYYRALLTVPSLIHTWVLDCKDRQLSSSITNYTSQYFSPVIIKAELARVKSPEATTALVDDSLSVKVASSVNEVMASYSVDDHQLEIKLKIPSDWPLHKIEVKDLKRVGVDENRWRAWILAVQQVIWSHNGTIVDGLGLFKKNVTLHFEGQVECAICYSIISVMDGSLPKKPCRTCKNRFHAGCLYKWFNTSHSSSCPLCRSDIF